MENPAKFLRQNKGRDMNDKTMKALANDILAKCQEQELSYTEMRTLIIMRMPMQETKPPLCRRRAAT